MTIRTQFAQNIFHKVASKGGRSSEQRSLHTAQELNPE